MDGESLLYAVALGGGAVAANQGVANAGKIMTVGSDGQVVPEDNRFVVTLTPTAADFSGTMDKTVAEIDAAYKAGQKIVFKVMENATSYIMADCSAQYFDEHVYPSFNAYIVMDGVGIVFAATGVRDNGAFNGYGTTIYPLTPMS